MDAPNRRDFLTTSAATTGAVVSGLAVLEAALKPARTNLLPTRWATPSRNLSIVRNSRLTPLIMTSDMR